MISRCWVIEPGSVMHLEVALEFGVRILAEHDDGARRASSCTLPSVDSSALPPPAFTAAFTPPQTEVPPGKSALLRPVPCQVMVQPPDCLLMLSAPSPVTSTCLLAASGSRPPLFLSSTSDWRTASRASARCSGEASILKSPASGRLRRRTAPSNMPARNFTRRMRVTASSRRSIGMVPSFDLLERVLVQAAPAVRRHVHVEAGVEGLRAVVVGAARRPGRAPFQSPTVKPSKFMRFLSTSVIRPLLPVSFDAVPARERDHDGLHAGFDGRHVARVVDVAQLGFRDLGVALVAAVLGAAVGQEVLGRGDHVRARAGSPARPDRPAGPSRTRRRTRPRAPDLPSSPRRRGPSDRPAARSPWARTSIRCRWCAPARR